MAHAEDARGPQRTAAVIVKEVGESLGLEDVLDDNHSLNGDGKQ